MKNKLLLSAMALAIATPAIVVPMTSSTVEAATYDKVFKDVTKKNVNFDIIHEMASQGE